MVDIKKIMVIISSIIVRSILLMLSVGYFAVYSPNFLKIPFDNFLESVHFTKLSEFELVIFFLIISILFEFFSETNFNLKNRIFQNRIFHNPGIRKFIRDSPHLSLFLFIIGFFIAFIATLLKNSFFTQMGVQLSSFGLFGLLVFILWVMMRYLQENPLHKSLSEHFILSNLTYKLKILIFLCIVFGITFIVLSLILISYGLGQQSYSTAMMASVALTAAIFSKIDIFITRDIVK